MIVDQNARRTYTYPRLHRYNEWTLVTDLINMKSVLETGFPWGISLWKPSITDY
jgi:hypothetical protein